MEFSKPSVGRIVHYHSHGTPGGEFLPIGEIYSLMPRAAVVTGTYEDESTVDVCVLNPTGIFFSTNLPYSEEPQPGHWSWPPRV